MQIMKLRPREYGNATNEIIYVITIKTSGEESNRKRVTVSFGITHVDTWNDCLKSSRRGVERIYFSGQIFAASRRAILTSRDIHTHARALAMTKIFFI